MPDDRWSADDAQCAVVRRNVQAANERSEALVGKLWDIALTPLEGLIGNGSAERQLIEAERVDWAKVQGTDEWELAELDRKCAEEEKFTQQDHEEFSAWLDEIYQAEQVERAAREADERRDDR